MNLAAWRFGIAFPPQAAGDAAQGENKKEIICRRPFGVDRTPSVAMMSAK